MLYIGQDILVKITLFLVAGIVFRLLGSYRLDELGGLYRYRPLLGILFLIPALSLAGLPPLSGFIAKLAVIRAALEQASWGITFVALLTGLLTLYSILRIWQQAFWRELPEHVTDTAVLRGERHDPDLWLMYLPVAVLCALILLVGLYAQPFFGLAEAAAEQLFSPQNYIEAVLGEEARP
jgi:multicomponent Na+:H+ antiporter subunit D